MRMNGCGAVCQRTSRFCSRCAQRNPYLERLAGNNVPLDRLIALISGHIRSLRVAFRASVRWLAVPERSAGSSLLLGEVRWQNWRGWLAGLVRFVGNQREVGWHLSREVCWHDPRGALAKIERCVGNFYTLTSCLPCFTQA